MQANQLVPAGTLAGKFGAKAIVYGGPGTGKTPIIRSAQRPVFLAVEPGLASMAGSDVPTWYAPTWAKIQEFFTWWHGSNETRNFDTLCVDSVSHICEIYLRENPGKKSHGLQLYGAMAEEVYSILHKLYYQEQKHMYLICKQGVEKVNDGTGKKRPYFPGDVLNISVPHLFDLILHLDYHAVPGYGVQRAFQCHSSFDSVCRDRFGKLAQFEPPDIAQVFNKAMSI